MGGLFIDVIILAIFRFFRRLYRVRQARSWPTAIAAPLRWHTRTPEDEYKHSYDDLQIEATVSYQANGKAYVGFIRSDGLGKSGIDRFFDELPKPEAIIIRYDPRNPMRMRALTEDNRGKVPFELAVE